MRLSIQDQFNRVAQEYDTNRKKFIPCFDDYYKETTKMICSNIVKPKRILDLGAGTGLLTYFWYEQCPTSEYVLVDIADEMLDVARKRFAGLDNISYQIMDYSKEFPDEDFDFIMSALSIHHLTNEDKMKVFARVYDKLPEGGIFINYDQFCAEQSDMNQWFNTYWEYQIAGSGLDDRNIELWSERRKLDKECALEDETEMLYKCKFRTVKCIYSYHKFSVVVAIK